LNFNQKLNDFQRTYYQKLAESGLNVTLFWLKKLIKLYTFLSLYSNMGSVTCLNSNNRIWKRTNKISALLLGVIAGVIATFAERADVILTGGSMTPLGFINTYTWILVAALLFGFWGAIITTEVQAIIGLITWSNPLSIVWPFVNLIFAIVVGAIAIGFSKLRPNAKIGTKLLTMSGACALLDIPLVYLVMMIFLPMLIGVPIHFMAYLTALPVYLVLQLGPSTFLAYLVVKALKRSKVLYLGEENENKDTQ